MARRAQVIVQQEHEPLTDGHRFAAILCFMLFYTWFVAAGTTLWGGETPRSRHIGDYLAAYPSLTKLAAAVILYLCGRSLWYQGRFARWWALVGVAAVSGVAAAEAASFMEFLASAATMGPLLPGLYSRWQVVSIVAGMLAWIAVLLLVVWFNGRPCTLGGSRYRPWVPLAVAWCLCGVLLSIFECDLACHLRPTLEILGLGFVAVPIDASLPILAAVLLLRGRQSARLMALVLAGIAMTLCCYSGFTLTWLLQMAIKALLASSIEPVDWYVSPFPLGIPFLNQAFFDAVFVQSVAAAGPWLLIAIYAWRIPMKMPPDDGSPFPRRYCGHCQYNLRGIESRRCPECGWELVDNPSW